ncbi:MAG TPA: hypothetical protein VE978_16375 [Chitinophagales bacterium]|nr:hypothetical protein [Chitinophagales bacterium]
MRYYLIFIFSVGFLSSCNLKHSGSIRFQYHETADSISAFYHPTLCDSFKQEKQIDSCRDAVLANQSESKKIIFVIRQTKNDRGKITSNTYSKTLLPGEQSIIGVTSLWETDYENCITYQVLYNYEITGAMEFKK